MPDVEHVPLTVAVRLMSEPCLWQWEIRDPTRNEIVETSWAHEWMAYESPDAALAAGQVRLTTLTDR